MRDQLESLAGGIAAYGFPLLLFAAGVVVKAIVATQSSLPRDTALWLSIVGDTSAVIGSLGIGQRFGRQQRDEALRVKLETAFRRTARLYERMKIVQGNVAEAGPYILANYARNDVLLQHLVSGALGAVSIRLDEQITTYDNALDEWHELVPAEVDRQRERLREQGSGRGRVIARA